MQAWPGSGLPDDPGARLYRVARNRVIDALRRERRNQRSTELWDSHGQNVTEAEEVALSHEVSDDELRLLFVCADAPL